MSEKTTARSYRDLVVWQKGIALVKDIYRLSSKFPAEEKFGLVSQMRRAAVSVPSNIAEGQARNTTSQFIHFISTAEGSLAELDTQLVIAIELDFCTSSDTQDSFCLIEEEQRMLNALRRSLEKK
jgi:four helix bundle protein